MDENAMNEPDSSGMTYDELATLIGYRMIGIVGVMETLGLTTLPHFVKTYMDPSQTDDPALRDFDRWFKWALSPKNSTDRQHLWPTEFVEICQATVRKPSFGKNQNDN